MQGVDLLKRGGHIGRMGGRHALGSNGVAGTDADRADTDAAGGVTLDLDQGRLLRLGADR